MSGRTISSRDRITHGLHLDPIICTGHYGTSKEEHPSQPTSMGREEGGLSERGDLSLSLKGELELRRQREGGKVFQVQETGGARLGGSFVQELKQSCISIRDEGKVRGKSLKLGGCVTEGVVCSLVKLGLYPSGNWKPLKDFQTTI